MASFFDCAPSPLTRQWVLVLGIDDEVGAGTVRLLESAVTACPPLLLIDGAMSVVSERTPA
jgi:hypothetical protein